MALLKGTLDVLVQRAERHESIRSLRCGRASRAELGEGR